MATAIDTPCPPTLEVRQSATAPPGWTVMLDPRGSADIHRLESVAFYTGTPQDLTPLGADHEVRVARGYKSIWKFTPGSGSNWIACSYSGTRIAAMRPLAANITVCEVTRLAATRRRPDSIQFSCY